MSSKYSQKPRPSLFSSSSPLSSSSLPLLSSSSSYLLSISSLIKLICPANSVLIILILLLAQFNSSLQDDLNSGLNLSSSSSTQSFLRSSKLKPRLDYFPFFRFFNSNLFGPTVKSRGWKDFFLFSPLLKSRPAIPFSHFNLAESAPAPIYSPAPAASFDSSLYLPSINTNVYQPYDPQQTRPQFALGDQTLPSSLPMANRRPHPYQGFYKNNVSGYRKKSPSNPKNVRTITIGGAPGGGTQIRFGQTAITFKRGSLGRPRHFFRGLTGSLGSASTNHGMSISLGGGNGKGISISIGGNGSNSKGRSYLRGSSNHKTYVPRYYDEEKMASRGNTITLPAITLGRGGITIGDDGYRTSNSYAQNSYLSNNYNGYKNNYYSYRPKPVFRLTLPEFSKTYIESNLKMPPIKVKLNSSPRVKITTGTKDPLGKDPLEDPEIEDIFKPPLPFSKPEKKPEDDNMMMINQTASQNGTIPPSGQEGTHQPPNGGQYPSYQPIYNGQSVYTGHPQPPPPSSLEYLSPQQNYNVQPSPNFVPLRGSNVVAPRVIYNQDLGNQVINGQLDNNHFNYNYQHPQENSMQLQANQNYNPNYLQNENHDSSRNDYNSYKTAASGTYQHYSHPTSFNSNMISTPSNNPIQYTQNVNNSESAFNKFHYSTGQKIHVFQQEKITNDQNYHTVEQGQQVNEHMNEQNQYSNGQVHYQNGQGQYITGEAVNKQNQQNYGQILYAYGPNHLANTQGQLDPGQIQYRPGSIQNGYSQDQNGHGVNQNGYGPIQSGYSQDQNGHGVNQNGYRPIQNGYSQDQNGHGVNQNGYGPIQNGYSQNQNGYGVNQNGYGSIQNGNGQSQNNYAQGYYKNDYNKYENLPPGYDTRIVKYDRATKEGPKVILNLMPRISLHRANESNPRGYQKHKSRLDVKLNPIFLSENDTNNEPTDHDDGYDDESYDNYYGNGKTQKKYKSTDSVTPMSPITTTVMMSSASTRKERATSSFTTTTTEYDYDYDDEDEVTTMIPILKMNKTEDENHNETKSEKDEDKSLEKEKMKANEDEEEGDDKKDDKNGEKDKEKKDTNKDEEDYSYDYDEDKSDKENENKDDVDNDTNNDKEKNKKEIKVLKSSLADDKDCNCEPEDSKEVSSNSSELRLTRNKKTDRHGTRKDSMLSDDNKNLNINGNAKRVIKAKSITKKSKSSRDDKNALKRSGSVAINVRTGERMSRKVSNLKGSLQKRKASSTRRSNPKVKSSFKRKSKSKKVKKVTKPDHQVESIIAVMKKFDKRREKFANAQEETILPSQNRISIRLSSIIATKPNIESLSYDNKKSKLDPLLITTFLRAMQDVLEDIKRRKILFPPSLDPVQGQPDLASYHLSSSLSQSSENITSKIIHLLANNEKLTTILNQFNLTGHKGMNTEQRIRIISTIVYNLQQVPVGNSLNNTIYHKNIQKDETETIGNAQLVNGHLVQSDLNNSTLSEDDVPIFVILLPNEEEMASQDESLSSKDIK